MDKQRLLELSGITEATYANQSAGWVVMYVEDGEWGSSAYAWGPFNSRDFAEQKGEDLMKSGLIDDYRIAELNKD